MIKDRWLLIIIVLGIIFRILLIKTPGFYFDVNDWFAWATHLSKVGPGNFYSQNYFSDYPPGYLYILYGLGKLKDIFNFSNPLFYIILKLPATFCDLLLGIFIYYDLSRFKISLARISAALIILNPALIFDSTIWGQIDSILALTLYLSIYYLRQKKLTLSSFFLTISILIKPFGVILLPLYLFYILKEKQFKKAFLLIIPSFITLLLIILPFYPKNTLPHFINNSLTTLNEYPYTSLNAYNLWGIVGFWKSNQLTFLNISYKNWGNIVFVFFIILSGIRYLKNKISISQLTVLSFLFFYFLPTQVHERYLYPALIFLIPLAIYSKQKILIILTLLLNLSFLTNLYFVYIYYNYFSFHSSYIYQNLLFKFLNSYSLYLSTISIIVFILIYIIIQRRYVEIK